MKDALESPVERIEIAGVDGDPPRLEELCDKNALREMVASCERIFGVPIRILSGTGTVLAGSAELAPVCALVNARPTGATACRAVIAETRQVDLHPGPRQIDCFTGASYRVIPIEYDRRPIGRIVIGPFIPTSAPRVEPATLAAASGLEPAEAERAHTNFPRVDPARVEELGAHVATVLDVILFSGHKALLTSQMHLASMRESYRELSEKNARLEEAYERLKELDRLKSNFLATVSHELRTPLTSIMGYGEMLAEGVAGPLNGEQLEFVETIRGKSDQLLGLIMSLLDLSKLESGTVAVRVGRIPIGSVVDEAVSTLAPAAMKKDVALEIDVPEGLPSVLGDPDRLRQVFINLLDNALKFTPPGGRVRVSARVTLEQPHDEPGLVIVAPTRPFLEVRVADTGVGIPEEEREKVFDPFYQVDQSSTREHGGAGLGLAIVKRLVEAHQGWIRAEPNTPHGAVFVVTLPAARTSLMPPSGRGSMPPPSGRDALPPVFG